MAAIAPSASRSTVELALRGRRSDVRERIFAAALLLSLIISLLVLMVLLASVIRAAWPVLSDRGFGFLNDNLSSFDERAGVRQGLIGSLILIAFVTVVAVPLGIGAAVYLQEYARDTRHQPSPDLEHPQPGGCAVDRLRDPRCRRVRAGAAEPDGPRVQGP